MSHSRALCVADIVGISVEFFQIYSNQVSERVLLFRVCRETIEVRIKIT